MNFYFNPSCTALEKFSVGFIYYLLRRNNKFIRNRITIVIDWKQSLPQIIAAIIGSSLIVSAFSSINSFVFKPIVDISKNVTGISLKNIGYTPATHVRMTIHYPDTNLLTSYNYTVYKNENMTFIFEDPSSVVAFLPRLTPGGSVFISARNFDSIVATYDQGSSMYRPPPPFFFLSAYSFQFYTSILIVLAVLSFAIAFRRKRKSKSKFVSDILTDVMKVRNELDDNNHKSDPNGIILRLHAWKSNIYKRHFIDDYRDYQKIDDFYSTVRSRKQYLLQGHVSTDELNKLNQDCVNKTTIIKNVKKEEEEEVQKEEEEIDWRKFHKLDLVLIIPAVVLGTFFMDAAVAGLLHSFPSFNVNIINVYYIIFSGISSFFIIRLILKASQGVIVDFYGLPPIHRSPALLLYCFVIVGIIPFLVNEFVLNHIYGIDYRVTTSFIVDIGSMFLLTWIVWKHYIGGEASSLHYNLAYIIKRYL